MIINLSSPVNAVSYFGRPLMDPKMSPITNSVAMGINQATELNYFSFLPHPNQTQRKHARVESITGNTLSSLLLEKLNRNIISKLTTEPKKRNHGGVDLYRQAVTSIGEGLLVAEHKQNQRFVELPGHWMAAFFGRVLRQHFESKGSRFMWL